MILYIILSLSLMDTTVKCAKTSYKTKLLTGAASSKGANNAIDRINRSPVDTGKCRQIKYHWIVINLSGRVV